MTNSAVAALYAEAQHVLERMPKLGATPKAKTSQDQLEKFVTAKEVADFLSVHPNYVYDQSGKGLLPSYKFGGHRRFRLSEVERCLERSYGEGR